MTVEGIAVDIFVPIGHYVRIDTYSYSAMGVQTIPPSVVFNYLFLPFVAEEIERRGYLNPKDLDEWKQTIRGVTENINGIRVGVTNIITPRRLRIETKDWARNQRVNMWTVDGMFRLWIGGYSQGTKRGIEKFASFLKKPKLPMYLGRNNFPVFVKGIYRWVGRADEFYGERYISSVIFYPYETSVKGYYPVNVYGELRWFKIKAGEEKNIEYTSREDYIPLFIDPIKRHEKEHSLMPYLSAIWGSPERKGSVPRFKVEVADSSQEGEDEEENVTSEELIESIGDRKDWVLQWAFVPFTVEKIEYGGDCDDEEDGWRNTTILLSPEFSSGWVSRDG